MMIKRVISDDSYHSYSEMQEWALSASRLATVITRTIEPNTTHSLMIVYVGGRTDKRTDVPATNPNSNHSLMIVYGLAGRIA